jgi:hypothetical protein
VNLPGLAVLFQAGALVVSPPAPTVGDTITVVRTIQAAADVRARPQPLGSSLLVEPLADPVVVRSGPGITIRYTLALFEPGRHPLGLPSVELVYRDGRVDQLRGDTVWITVRSLLPKTDSLLEPKGSLGPVSRFPTRTTPLLVMVAVVVTTVGGWVTVRRRLKPAGEPPVAAGVEATAPLMRWIAAGEGRAVAAVAADRLRSRIAALSPEASRALSAEECIRILEERHPDWPIRELSDVLHGLERARFAPAMPGDVALLVDRVDSLMDSLSPARTS